MKVHNPNKLPTVDIRSISELQGGLKDLSQDNYAKLKKSIEKHGFMVPVFVWKNGEEQFLVDGHQRKRVLESEGWTEKIPALIVEAKSLKDAKMKLAAVSSQYGKITQEGWDEFTADLPEAELIETVNFDALPYLNQDDEVVEDEVPGFGKHPKSKKGEVYQLGNHRLMCGDATTDIEKLLGGKQIDLMSTDAPYGVSYGDKNVFLNAIWPANRIQENMDSDTMEVADMKKMWIGAFSAAFKNAKEGAAYYCHAPQGGELMMMMMMMSLLEGGWELKHSIIWVKNNHVLGRADYNYKHEPILYGWKGSGHYFAKSGDTSVWEFDRPHNSDLHPTMKPVGLIAREIENSSREGELVYDAFGGSGTTLIACEQLNRICYMMEIDPKYCDVIRKRYWKLISDTEEDWEHNTSAISESAEKNGKSKSTTREPEAV